MPLERDPLSAAYDGAAADLIGRAIARYHRYYEPARAAGGRHAAPGRREVRAQARQWQPGILQNSWHYPVRDDGKDHLTRLERAFQRALYYDARIVNMNAKWHPDAEWSLKIEWDAFPAAPGLPRSFRVRVFSPSSAARHARRLPRSQSYGKNPELLASSQDLPR